MWPCCLQPLLKVKVSRLNLNLMSVSFIYNPRSAEHVMIGWMTGLFSEQELQTASTLHTALQGKLHQAYPLKSNFSGNKHSAGFPRFQ